MDFSYAGYRNGEEDLPNLPVVHTISPVAGDNTAHIQAAIDYVGAMPADANGHRGALLLNPGTYEVSGVLNVNVGGVVVRGSGQGSNPANNTIIRPTGTQRRPAFIVGTNVWNGWNNNKPGTHQNITSEFIPAGSRTFTVANTAPYQVGDNIIIRHTATDAWLSAVNYGNTAGDVLWEENDIRLVYNRHITRIVGNTIEVDVPIYHDLDRSLTQSTLSVYTRSTILTESGIENLRIDIETAGPSDENHADIGIFFRGAEDSWARDVTVLHFSRRGFETQQATRITVLDCSAIEPHSPITGGRRYSFSAVDHSNQILFKGCYGDKGRHIFITNGGATTSGVVFTQSTGERSYTTSESHRRWGSAILWDQLDFINSNTNFVLGIGHNRGSFGTGHGWTGTGLVGWNVTSDARIVVQEPPIGQNFAIGNRGEVNNLGPWVFPAGFIEGTGQTPSIASLYEAQLAERLTYGVGPSAPARLKATHWSNSGTRFVALQWIDTAIDETNFVVERSSDGGNSYSVIDTLPANSVSYTDTNVSQNGTYIYRVKATNANGFSAYSNRLPVNLAATQLPKAVTYQAEDFTGSFKTTPVRAPHLGYTGWGFVDMEEPDSWFEWDKIDGGMGGTVPVTIRYSSTNDRPCEITVNGNNPVDVTFTSSGGWSNWATLTVDLPLSAGTNTIRISSTTSARGPNVDKMEVFATPVMYAAGEVTPGETAAQAFDGDSATQWKHYSPYGSWLQRAFPVALTATDYTVTSGQGAQANDPKDWTLLGSNDHGESWTTLDTQSGVLFGSRGESKTYTIANGSTYKLYRLHITAVRNLSDADSVQLAELDFSYDSVPAVSPDPAAFSEAPHAISENEISMTAVTGTSAFLNTVEYYFEETSGNPGGSDSGWITSPTYTDTGLNTGVQYTYTVTMRDAPNNEGTSSQPYSATTYLRETSDWDPGAGSDGQWTTDANWSGGIAPLDAEQYLRIRFDGGEPESTLDQTAVVAQMIIGHAGGALFDNRVTLASGADLTAGLSPFDSTDWTAIGYNNLGTLYVESGAVFTTAGHLWVGFRDPSIGKLIIDGGTVNVGQQFGLGWDGGTGIVELRAGTLNLDRLDATRSISGESYVDIEDGTIVIGGDYDSVFSNYVSAGKITAFGGDGKVLIDYDPESDETRVTGLSSETIVSFESPPTEILEGDDLHLRINATDADGIDRVYLFKNGIQLSRSEGALPYQFGAPGQNDPELQNMAPGVYEFRAMARDLLGNEGEATISITVLAAVVRINFQPSESAVPSGYLADTSQVFGDRGNGFSYGWTTSFDATRERNSDADQRLDTLNHTQAQSTDRVWEIELPNGRYIVNLTGGDPDFDNSFIEFVAEACTANETTLVSGDPDGVNFISGSETVTVSDGRLTISNGPNAENNKINFVDIFSDGAQDPYQAWKDLHNITDDFGDEDNDGIVNLLEFALGGDPRSAGTATLPHVRVSRDNLAFTLQRQEETITYVIEKSTDLVNWVDFETVTDAHGAVGEQATVSVPTAEMNNGKLFLRLRVEG